MAARSLDAEQQALVVEHLRVAEIAADSFRTKRFDREERLSAAYLGLCQAALTWNKSRGILFSTYANHAARNEIRQLWRRPKPPPSVPIEDAEPAAPEEPPDNLDEMLAPLTDEERQVIILYLNGCSREETMEATGLSFERVRYLRWRAITVLRESPKSSDDR